jgi:hypothetical protein
VGDGFGVRLITNHASHNDNENASHVLHLTERLAADMVLPYDLERLLPNSTIEIVQRNLMKTTVTSHVGRDRAPLRSRETTVDFTTETGIAVVLCISNIDSLRSASLPMRAQVRNLQ